MERPVAPRAAWRAALLERQAVPAFQRWTLRFVDRERAAYLVLVVIAFTMRIWDVGARAMHHDESLHATYAWYLFKGLGYQYNPLMHGPLKFFATAFFFLLFGDSETTARLLAVLCGTAIVCLPYFLRHEIGRVGAFIAAIALTISPAFLYYSRFDRDDIILAFLTLVMVVAMWRVLGSPGGATNRRWVLTFAAAAALAMATMEAAYIAFFIVGTFLAMCVLIERLRRRLAGVDRSDSEPAHTSQPLTTALRSIRAETWIYAGTIFVAITLLLYSSFFTNPAGIFDPNHSLTSPNRVDILGGITYWLSQHGVARGGQPWFYYFLLLPLYEQFALLFGAAGVVWAFFRRHLFTSFLAYWFVMSLAIYSWAGEKMPWLLLHPLLPGILLASSFTGWLLAPRRAGQTARNLVPATSSEPDNPLSQKNGSGLSRGWRTIVVVVLVVLALIEIHSAQALAYSDGANPTEMLIYVQTSNDVPTIAGEMIGLAHKIQNKRPLPLIQVDSADLQGWPFEWYFRNLPTGDVTYSSAFSNPTAPILIMLGPEQAQYGAGLTRKYVAAQYIWNWWFPEDYKGLTFDNGVCGTALAEISCLPGQKGMVFLKTGTPCPPSDTVAGPNCSLIQTVPAINVFSSLANGSTWQHLWNWFLFRTPFGQRGTRQLFLYVRRDLVHKYGGSLGGTIPSPSTQNGKPLAYSLLRTISNATVSSPRGIATGRSGRIYVADAGTHRVDIFGQNGKLAREFGTAGARPGQFSLTTSPMAVAVNRRGDMYAADFWNHRIEEFGPAGAFIRAWGSYGRSGPYAFYGPRSIAIAPDGDVVVADTGNRRIAIFSPAGHFLFQIGSAGTASGQFEEPSSVAVAGNGNIYVADFWNSRIQYFGPTGTYLGQWQVSGWQNGSYLEPYLAVLSNGDVAASVPAVGSVDVFSPHGRALGTVTVPSVTAPLGLAGGHGSTLFLTDSDSNRVTVLRLRLR